MRFMSDRRFSAASRRKRLKWIPWRRLSRYYDAGSSDTQVVINLPCTGMHAPVRPGLYEADLGVGPELAESCVHVEHRHAQRYSTRQEGHGHQTTQLFGLIIWGRTVHHI